MKYLLYAAILGYSCWMLSEVFEIVQGGYNPTVYYLTASYHFFAGLGIWGLHKKQMRRRDIVFSIGALVTAVTFMILTVFPIQVMNSGLPMAEFTDANPEFKIIGLLWFIGMITFGIGVVRMGYYPAWSGYVIILGTILFIAVPLSGSPLIYANISNILFSITLIYMSILALIDTNKNQ